MVTPCGRAPIDLPAGRHLYCGFKGPGGSKARLSCHFQCGKSVRWHIDQLTERGRLVGSWIFPGGNERISCHFQRGKSVRWHIDQLTGRARLVGSWIFPGGNERKLVRELSPLPVPLPGFGSSDCATCRSHLLRWSNGIVLPLCGPF